jgi:hypothetical protein
VLSAVAAGVLMLGLLGAWLGGVLKVKTPDCAVVLENVPADRPPVSPTAETVRGSTGRTVDNLAASTEGAWTPLFNRKNLSGWMFPRGSRSDWTVEEGVVTSSAEYATIATSRSDYADFRLRVELQTLNGRPKVIGIRSSLDAKTPNSFSHYTFATGGLSKAGNTNTVLPLGGHNFRNGQSITKEGLRELTPPTLAPLKQQTWYKAAGVK